MSQDFKLKFEEYKENEPGAVSSKDDAYPGPGNTRNLGFVWPDGKMMFLNYAYLVSGSYTPEANEILLEFTTHTAKLTGYNLKSLFQDLMLQLPRLITATDPRYNQLNQDKPIINKIDVTTKA